VPVRIIKPEEILECEKIQSIAFISSLDIAQLKKELAENPNPPDRYIGFFNEENVITACMELPEYQVRYEDGRVKMIGLGGVASLPEHRFGGAVRQTVYAAFRLMREEGAVFSCLYPFSHPYYRQFGYETCQLSASYTLPIQALRKFRCGAAVCMLLPGEGVRQLQAVFDRHFLGCNLPVQREARHWKKLTGSDPYKERTYTYLLEREKEPCAYVIFSAQRANSQEDYLCQVREMAFTGPQGLSDALGFLYRLSAQYNRVRLPLPENIPLPALLDESYEIKTELYSHAMGRVIHLQKALEQKRHFEGADYTLRAVDEAIPENDGIFHIHCQNGRVSVERCEAAADLTADIRTMALLLLGAVSLDEALYRPDVQAAANLDTLRAVFIRRPVFLTDHF
jgi:predicted acetyltransferase